MKYTKERPFRWIHWAGHGPNDDRGYVDIEPGQLAPGIDREEGDVNFLFALYMRERAAQYDNLIFELGRDNISENQPIDDSKSSRGELSRGRDLATEGHSNATGTSLRKSGPLILGNTKIEDREEVLEIKVGQRISAVLGLPNNGVWRRKNSKGQNWYGFLRNNYATKSFMFESIYHDNPNDVKVYEGNLKPLAFAIVDEVCAYYGLPRKVTSEQKTDEWMSKIKATLVETGVMSDGGWDEPATKGQVASWLYTAIAKGILK